MVSARRVKVSLVAAGTLMLVGCFGSGEGDDLGLSEYYYSLEVQAEQNAEEAREAELEWADHQDAWADTYLGAEKAEAIYWRQALVKRDPVTNKPMGSLVTMTTREVLHYPCDQNYEHAQSGGCVPADRDYDCWELRSWGMVNIPVRPLNPNTNPPMRGDWMLLDDDHDGAGCEFSPTPE